MTCIADNYTVEQRVELLGSYSVGFGLVVRRGAARRGTACFAIGACFAHCLIVECGSWPPRGYHRAIYDLLLDSLRVLYTRRLDFVAIS